jgi:hypothetical protein
MAVAGLAGGTVLTALGANMPHDSKPAPEQVGYYMVGSEDGDAISIGRKFADDNEHVNDIANFVQDQADENGYIHAGQWVAIQRNEVNDPQAPELQAREDLPKDAIIHE